MKKIVPMLMTAGVIATFVGCAEESDPVSANTPPSASVTQTTPETPTATMPETTPPEGPAAAEAILVSLSVPNMV